LHGTTLRIFNGTEHAYATFMRVLTVFRNTVAAFFMLALFGASNMLAQSIEPQVNPPGKAPILAPPGTIETDRATKSESTHLQIDTKSRMVATSIAIIGSAVGPILVAAGASGDNNNGAIFAGAAAMVILPSAGKWYAGKTSLGSMGVRALGGVIYLSSANLIGGCTRSEDESCEGAKLPGMILGGGLYAAATLWDIFTVAGDVDDYNRLHRGARITAIAPLIERGSRTDVTGLAMSGTF
jgi:hypothetical protein